MMAGWSGSFPAATSCAPSSSPTRATTVSRRSGRRPPRPNVPDMNPGPIVVGIEDSGSSYVALDWAVAEAALARVLDRAPAINVSVERIDGDAAGVLVAEGSLWAVAAGGFAHRGQIAGALVRVPTSL